MDKYFREEMQKIREKLNAGQDVEIRETITEEILEHWLASQGLDVVVSFVDDDDGERSALVRSK